MSEGINSRVGHALSAFEESFLEDGVTAVCECGWKSQRHITQGNAIEEHLKHREQAYASAAEAIDRSEIVS